MGFGGCRRLGTHRSGVFIRYRWATRVRYRARRRWPDLLGVLAVLVLVGELTHLGLSQRHGNTIDAYLYTCSKTLCLEIVLRSQFPGALGDYRRVR